MKIRLSAQQSFCLAEVFAQEIHARVISMHMWVSDYVFHTPEAPFATKQPSTAFNEVCAAIRSLPPGSDDRRQFVANIKWHFQRIRKERSTDVKWQDYLARVREVNKGRIPTPYVYSPNEVAA